MLAKEKAPRVGRAEGLKKASTTTNKYSPQRHQCKARAASLHSQLEFALGFRTIGVALPATKAKAFCAPQESYYVVRGDALMDLIANLLDGTAEAAKFADGLFAGDAAVPL